MRAVTATDFTRNFAEYQHEVRRETVVVTSHSRVTGYFVSPEDFAEFESLREKARKSIRVGNLSEATIEALTESRMDDRHSALNVLMQD